MPPRSPRLAVAALTAALLAPTLSHAAPLIFTTTPYLSQADSTINPASPNYYLETFEDGSLNLPGVSFTAVAGSGIQPGLSVDADDGSIDGSGAAGKHFAAATAAFNTSTTFFFSPVAGQWPKQVAIAVTAGTANNLSFGAYDTNNNPTGNLLLNLNTTTPTSDDFLVTFKDNAGIGAIAIVSSQASSFIHFDHLQFNTDTFTVPEPASLAACGLATLPLLTRRRHT